MTISKIRLNWFAATIFVTLAVASVSTFARPKAEFSNTKIEDLEQVSDKTFVNQLTDIDGKRFRHCKFINVRFRYQGKATFAFQDSEFNGFMLESDNKSVEGAWFLTKGLGLAPSVPVLDNDLKPLPNIHEPTPRP